MNLMRGIDLKKIAEKMNGASGAELKVNFLSSMNTIPIVDLLCLVSYLSFWVKSICRKSCGLLFCKQGKLHQ